MRLSESERAGTCYTHGPWVVSCTSLGQEEVLFDECPACKVETLEAAAAERAEDDFHDGYKAGYSDGERDRPANSEKAAKKRRNSTVMLG